MSDRDRLIANPGRTEIERVRSKHIEIKDVGTTVKIRDEIHARTNHYIKQSKPYFPKDKLLTYIDCPYFLRVARWLCFASWSPCCRRWIKGYSCVFSRCLPAVLLVLLPTRMGESEDLACCP